MALDKIFKPEKNYLLSRLGSMHDGGYLVGDTFKKCDTLISLGVADDWNFEKHFKKIRSNAKVICYDNKKTLYYLIKNFLDGIIYILYYKDLRFIKYFKKIIDFFKIRKKIKFVTKYIYRSDLKKILNNFKSKNILLKIDIEGSEYRLLDEIVLIQDKLNQLIIEFHDLDYHQKKIISFIKKLKMKLVYIHPNNCGPLDNNSDPTVIECTFERNPKILNYKKFKKSIYAMKNCPLKKNIHLKFKK